MHYSAVLFDLDGTLLDTLGDIGGAANEVLAGRDLPVHSPADYRQFIGDGVAMLFTRALPPSERRPEVIDACVEQFAAVYDRRWNETSRPYDGVTELLTTLASRGVKLAVLSNKPHPFTLRCVEQFFPDVRFELVLGQRPTTPRKPDPAGALEIVRHLGIPPGQIVYLGDSAVDMRTAIGAGLEPAGALWGFRGREELAANGARWLLASPLELLRLWE